MKDRKIEIFFFSLLVLGIAMQLCTRDTEANTVLDDRNGYYYNLVDGWITQPILYVSMDYKYTYMPDVSQGRLYTREDAETVCPKGYRLPRMADMPGDGKFDHFSFLSTLEVYQKPGYGIIVMEDIILFETDSIPVTPEYYGRGELLSFWVQDSVLNKPVFYLHNYDKGWTTVHTENDDKIIASCLCVQDGNK